MSSSDRPVPRRRIAGESAPGRSAGEPPHGKGKVSNPRKRSTVAKKSAPAKAVNKLTGSKAKVAKAPSRNRGATKVTQTVEAIPAGTSAEPELARSGQARTSSQQPPSAAPSTRASARELRWFVPTVVLAIAVLVLGSVLLVKGVNDRRGGGDLVPAQEAAAKSASEAAETIFSFRYDKLPDHLRDAKAAMTPAFAKEFDKIAPALTDLAPQRKIVVQAAARNAAALDCGSDCSSDKATILVFVDQARLAAGSEQPTVFANRITVSMVKSKGVWLVNDIRAL